MPFPPRESILVLTFASTEADLELADPHSAPRRLIIKLDFSDVNQNATIALNNLLALVDDDEELPLDLKLQDTNDKIDRLVKQGKALMQSNLSDSAQNAFPQLDSFVDTVDQVVQVRRYNSGGGIVTCIADFPKAHPLLNVGWQLVAIIYKVSSRLFPRATVVLSPAQDCLRTNQAE